MKHQHRGNHNSRNEYQQITLPMKYFVQSKAANFYSKIIIVHCIIYLLQ
jgi:hypothetical protein